MASIRIILGGLALVLICACQKSESIDELSRGQFSVAPDTITLRIKLYCPSPGKFYKDLFVYNFSTLVESGELKLDSDADGLTDELETKVASLYNVSSQLADTNQDFFSDFLMYLAGISILQQELLRCGDGANIDNDQDGVVYRDQFIGLNNCEESRLTLTDPNKFDTDGDGIPDYLELRCGLNPRNGADVLLDSDADGISNIEECKFGTPINESNLSRSVAKFATKYDIQIDAYNNPGCMQIEISNLAVLNGSGSNLIGVYLVEKDVNNQTSVHTEWLEVTDGANGRTYTKDSWPDLDKSQPWQITQPR